MTQEHALSILKTGTNVFLTGSAGTGKTYVLNQYIQYLKDRKVPVAITASTGIASTHIGGVTIHSWAGIGVKESLTGRELAGMKTKKYLKDKIAKAKVLIIDEISMLHKKQLDLVDLVLQSFKDNIESFGDLQVVFCGDFFQLPPVGVQQEKSRDKFAFMSKAWVDAGVSVCYLTKQYRQSDHELNDLLNEIRTNTISQQTIDLLKSANTPLKLEPTKLYTHNADVDRINQEFLEKLPGKKRYFKATTTGDKQLVEVLKKTVLAGNELQLKIGAKVMFVKNNYDKGYINGTLGEVIEYSGVGLPVVKLTSGDKITVTPEKWSIDDDSGKSLASFNQIPLRLAWAITVHKSQGMTLEAAEIDLTKTFESGQGYVALSRLKSLNKLYLRGFNQKALTVDTLALKADKRFKELSQLAEDVIDLDKNEMKAKDFIRACGGRVLKKL
ncbi:MAG: PIF1 family DEAD/DEAH box helicase [Flavobacteriales bacterium]|jgi:ATP-dependent exoDNAse (exonuclease V) alpha subunit|nr:PIF1 family DEAD/DEAH box helicase [Flavobacteriales bacterium]